jgi:hypothetical protein
MMSDRGVILSLKTAPIASSPISAAFATPKLMNPDGTNPDRQPPAHPPEIIDVRVVEEISSVPEPLEDAWESEEVAAKQMPTDPIPDPIAVGQEQLEPSEPTATTLTSEDNWAMLLDEISQASDLESNIEPTPSVTVPDDRTASLLRAEAEIKTEIAKLQATRAALQQQIVNTQTSFGEIIQTAIGDLEQRLQ